MSASAQSVVSDASAAAGPSLSVHQKRDSVSHAAYEVVEEDFVAEYGATTTLYKHKKSGAEVLSVQIDDDNKVFRAAVVGDVRVDNDQSLVIFFLFLMFLVKSYILLFQSSYSGVFTHSVFSIYYLRIIFSFFVPPRKQYYFCCMHNKQS